MRVIWAFMGSKGSAYQEEVRSTPLTRARGKTHIKMLGNKERKGFNGYSLKPSWAFVIGFPTHFDFVTLRHL